MKKPDLTRLAAAVLDKAYANASKVAVHVAQNVVINTGYYNENDTKYLSKHLLTHGTAMPFGNVYYRFRYNYIKQLDKPGLVVEKTPRDSVFWYKGYPVWFAELKGGSAIQVFRGTIDLDELLADAADTMNAVDVNPVSGIRFHISYHSGYGYNESVPTTAPTPNHRYAHRSVDDDHDKLWHHQALRHRLEDLAPPVPEDPFMHLQYDDDVASFIKTVDHWKNHEAWYKERTVPWRFSGLLLGPPGSGKSSFVRAIAQKHDLPVHVIDLPTMNNKELRRTWDEVSTQAPCIILLDDIDRMFGEDGQFITNEDNVLTLDCLLNCISGVATTNGILLLATANHPENIDAAMLRPGRLDKHIWFRGLTVAGASAVADRILKGLPAEAKLEAMAGVTHDYAVTGAVFERTCQDIALRYLWSNV